MRQFRIMSKTAENEYVILDPEVNKELLNIPEIRDSISFLSMHDRIQMIGIVFDTRVYSLVVVDEDELQEDHIEL